MIGGVALTIESGGLLAFAGNSGLTGEMAMLTTASNREFMVHALGDLSLAGPLVGTSGGLNKSGAGKLTLGSAYNTFTGNVVVQEGTLKLNGGDFTILPNQSLVLLGGAIDLNGATQHFSHLQAQSPAVARNDFYAANYAGNVTNTSAQPATLALAAANVSFTGRIRDAVNVLRSQTAGSYQDWNLSSDQDFTGKMLLNGGRTQLVDAARLSGLSALEISNASVLFAGNNTANQPVPASVDRLRDEAGVTIRGGMLQFRAYAGNNYAEVIGALTLNEGASIIDIAEPGTGTNQYDVTAASLARANGSHATLRFMSIDGAVSGKARLFFSSAPTLTNRLIGGWAVFETEFASYTSGMGVGGLSTAGYAGYDTAIIHNAATTDNVRIGTIGTTTLSADRDINSLALVVAGATTLNLGGKIITLRS